MSEQVQEEEALHLESDVRIDDDAQAVEDAGARRLEIAILDREPLLDHARRDLAPDLDEIAARQLPHQPGAVDFVAGNHVSAPTASVPTRPTGRRRREPVR